jgi:hypothetical protein
VDLRGELGINPADLNPGRLAEGEAGSEPQVVVPFTGIDTTSAALERAEILMIGLNARVLLLAVHTLPYPLPFVCPTTVHAHLVKQLTELASHCALTVQPLVVLSRDRMEGFQRVLRPGSTVVMTTRRSRLWATRFCSTQEEKLARALARCGHIVALLQIE